MKAGFIGLGIMGSRMAANVQKAGHSLIVHNRTRNKATALLDAGATWAASPAGVAKEAEVIITMLTGPDAVLEVTEGKDGLFETPGNNRLWINASTINPSFARLMAQKATAAGYRYLDAPVAGSKAPAESGELVFFAGSEEEAFKEAQPLLETMSQKAMHLGPSGQGSAMKMLVNQLLGVSMQAFSEAMALGIASGLPQELLMQVIPNLPVVPPYLRSVAERLQQPGGEVHFPLKHLLKDFHMIDITAYETGTPMPATLATKNTLAQAIRHGDGEADFSRMYDFVTKGSR